MKQAMLYEELSEDKACCHLCAHRCLVAEGKTGICHVRQNRGGTLYTLVYGRTIAQHVDPMEKKPLSFPQTWRPACGTGASMSCCCTT